MYQTPLLIRVTSQGQEVRILFAVKDTSVTCDCEVAAEYLAKGYTLSDGILQRAIQLDSESNPIV